MSILKVQSKLDLLKKIEKQKQIVNNHVQSLQNSIRDKGEEIKCQLNQLYVDGELECEQMDAMEKLKEFTLDSKNLGIRYFQEDMRETQSNIDGLQSKFDTLASYKPQVICEKKTFEIVIEEGFYLKPHLEENYKNKRDIIWEKAKKGSLRTQLSAPNSLDIDKTNNFVYIADTKNCRVQIFTENGDHFSAILLPENFCPLKVRILPTAIYIYGNWNDNFYLASCHRKVGCFPDNNGFQNFQSVPELVSFDISELSNHRSGIFTPFHTSKANTRFLGYLANGYHVILDFPCPSQITEQSFSGATCRTGGLGGTTVGMGAGITGGLGGTTVGMGAGITGGLAGTTGGLGGTGGLAGTTGGTSGSGGATVGFGGGTGTSQGLSPFIPTTSTAIFPQPQFAGFSNTTNQNYIYLKSIYLQDNTQALDLQSLLSHSHITIIYVLYRYCQFAVLAFNSNGICLRSLVEMDTCKIPYAFSVDSQANIVILSGKQKERSNKIKLDADEVKTSELLVYNKEDLLSSLTLHEDPDNIADICSDTMFDIVLIFSDEAEEGGMIQKY